MSGPRGNPNPIRPPGFQPGHPKWGGRKKNVEPSQIKRLCLQMSPEACAELKRLMLHDRNGAVRVSAARELLDRGLGKPSQAHVVQGDMRHLFQVVTHAKLFGTDEPVTINATELPALNGHVEDGGDDQAEEASE